MTEKIERSAGCTATIVVQSAPVRSATIDFTKGTLVVIMVAYHSINYFKVDKDVLRYLHFLPASFIFITGFLISYVYRSRVRTGETGVYTRLIVRGAKLLAVFILLNVAAHSLFTTNYNHRNLGLDFFINELKDIFVTGEPRVAVFNVLLPISYLLLVAAPLLAIDKHIRSALPIVASLALVACVWLNYTGGLAFNLDLLSMGVLGLLAGLTPLSVAERLAGRTAALLVAFVGYQVAVTYAFPSYAMNLVAVPLTLLVIYASGRKLVSRRALGSSIVLLGKYSLVTYIVQIVLLQFLFRASRPLGLQQGMLPVAFVIALLLTVASAHLVARGRRRFKPLDAAYSAVFA